MDVRNAQKEGRSERCSMEMLADSIFALNLVNYSLRHELCADIHTYTRAWSESDRDRDR